MREEGERDLSGTLEMGGIGLDELVRRDIFHSSRCLHFRFCNSAAVDLAEVARACVRLVAREKGLKN